MCGKVDVQYSQVEKVKIMTEINKSSTCFSFSKFHLGSEKLGSSWFLFSGKIIGRDKHLLMLLVAYFDLLCYM